MLRLLETLFRTPRVSHSRWRQRCFCTSCGECLGESHHFIEVCGGCGSEVSHLLSRGYEYRVGRWVTTRRGLLGWPQTTWETLGEDKP